MSAKDTTPPGERPKPLKGTVRSLTTTERGMQVVLRLQNPNTRAMHYIADVRGMEYDPATRRLTVRLTDEGRIPIPSTVQVQPTFRFVDPDSEAEIRLDLPQSIVRLGTPSPTGEVTLEEHRIADAEEVVIDVAWADTPYYEDARPSAAKEMPTARWQQGKSRVSYKLRR